MSFQTDLPCAATGRVDVQRCLHHVYTRKSRPDLAYKKWNLMPLCLEKHNEVHTVGLYRFSKNHPSVNDWLLKNGWEFDSFSKKWINRRAYELN